MKLEGLLVDTSALVRLLRAGDAADAWRSQISAGLVALCSVVELELMWTARNAADRALRQRRLQESFTWVPTPNRVFERALAVQGLLTDRGQHRSAGALDLLVAATAELSALTLLHYDRDFETVAEVTGQPTRWVAPPGSIA